MASAGFSERGFFGMSKVAFFGFFLLAFALIALPCYFLSHDCALFSLPVIPPAVMFASVGIIKPFNGGNEAEWTRYLEKLLQGERDQLKAILNTMEEGIAIIGQDRVIRFMNPSLVKEFGDGVGAYCYQHLHGGMCTPSEHCMLSGVISGASQKWERRFVNGKTFDITYSPFTYDDEPAILATFVNITERKLFETQLVELNDMKSELLELKANQLDEISHEVAKLEEEKLRFLLFLGVVAHDLKSPLAASQSMLWEIMGGFSGPVNDEQKDIMERITRRIDGLTTLINDLVDIPLIETGQLVREMTEVSLREVIESSVEGFTSLAAQKGLLLKLVLPATLSKIHGSERRLQQVMHNLVSNAIKYSERGTVLVRVIEDEQGVRVEVADNGVGIPAEDLPRLFEDFFRGKNAAVAKGTGLGLSIARRIVEAHDGSIWAESPNPETNTGSRFVFTLPKNHTIQQETLAKENSQL
jgi:signal transduction histidine kinase